MGIAPDADAAANIKFHNNDYGRQMALKGFVTYSLDWLGFGERDARAKPHYSSAISVGGEFGRDPCNVYYLCATMLGTTVLAEEDVLVETPPPAISPYDRPGKWYVLHTQSGYENKVRQNIEARTKSMGMEGRIHEIAIPMEEVTEFKAGKKVVAQKKMFPGYLLIRCTLDDDSWYVIRNTPGVTGFVGAANKPSPLSRKDVENFISTPDSATEEAPKRARPRLEYELHESVRVKEGPFADFSGEIVEINEDHLKMKVLVNIFGRETPVELEFSQVAKL
jgi:transcriptional antiterminator NusG